jgi:hypothetical protein
MLISLAYGLTASSSARWPIAFTASGTTVTPGISAAARYSAALTRGGTIDLLSRSPIAVKLPGPDRPVAILGGVDQMRQPAGAGGQRLQ